MKQSMGTLACRLFSTDASKTINLSISPQSTQILAYNAFGYGGTPQIAFIGYAGQMYDNFVNGYHLGNGYRTYCPALMRFLSPDSDSPFDAGGINSYAYVKGDPINFFDPTGHAPSTIVKPQLSHTGGIRVVNKLRTFQIPNTHPSGGMINVIVAHGGPGYIGGKYTWSISPSTLKKRFSAAGIDLSAQPLHLISCHSADTDFFNKKSYAQKLSNIIGQPVLAYKGVVLATSTKIPRNQSHFIGKVKVRTTNPFDPSDKNYSKFNYSPIVVYPDQAQTNLTIRGGIDDWILGQLI